MSLSRTFQPFEGLLSRLVVAVLFLSLVSLSVDTSVALGAKTNTGTAYNQPTWWAKYQHLLNNSQSLDKGPTSSVKVGSNIDVSNEKGPQSETAITLNPANPDQLVAGSNEIDRLAMRGYYSSDGGTNWGAVDLPLPPASTTNGTDFGSDPAVAFDTRGNVYYGYIIVFFNRQFASIQGTEMAVAKSSDGGRSWPQVTYFNFNSGTGKFNDKPMLTVDTNPTSPYRDTVYIAWDNASYNQGKSSANNALLLSHSTDGGLTFSSPVTLNSLNGGPNSVIGADPFVGSNGEVYVAWADIVSSRIMVNRSFDGGQTFGQEIPVAATSLSYQAIIPAQASRGALIYPACDTDRSNGPNRGSLYCSWMDGNGSSGTDIFEAYSTNQGVSWSEPVRVNDDAAGVNRDQFNQWLSVDPVTGTVNLSWYDTRNDPNNTKTDVYLGVSTNGGLSYAPNIKVTDVPSDESAANPYADAGDQYGDYEGIVAYGGTIHPVWTDGRFDQVMGEEVFTAAVTVTK
ncbi:MAG TPA: sialidase family protein [Chloroflexia bacterium]|nr:sialidase family protein [Chloroflexia bacterium]